MKITQFFVRQNKDDEKNSCLSDCFEIFVIQSGWFLYMILLYIYKKNLKDSQILSIFFYFAYKTLARAGFSKISKLHASTRAKRALAGKLTCCNCTRVAEHSL